MEKKKKIHESFKEIARKNQNNSSDKKKIWNNCEKFDEILEKFEEYSTIILWRLYRNINVKHLRKI